MAIVGGALGLLVVAALVLPLLVDGNRYRPRLESAASNALGMDVRIDGRVRIDFLPRLQLVVKGGRILADSGVAIASAKETKLRIALLPLLRRQVRLSGVQLTAPMLRVERGPDGALNVERLRKATALLGALDGATLSLAGGTLRYADRRSGEELEATGVDLKVSRLRFQDAAHPLLAKGVTIRAELACAEIRTKKYSASAIKTTVNGTAGRFEVEPVTLRIFAGQMTGKLSADLSGPVPRCELTASLPQFRIEEFLKTLSPEKGAEGAMDFSAKLTLQGANRAELARSAAGEVSLRGRDLTLVGNDLDATLVRIKSTQSFNFVDIGAVFLAGPMGLAVTKGYNFASLFKGSGGTGHIAILVSDWTVERGVAHAKDVALATARNRLAMKGALDFANERFDELTVAAIDAQGCVKVRQTIRGPFAKPEVERPNVLMSLAGPVLKLYKQTRGLLPSAPCEVFYAGSVAAPK